MDGISGLQVIAFREQANDEADTTIVQRQLRDDLDKIYARALGRYLRKEKDSPPASRPFSSIKEEGLTLELILDASWWPVTVR